MYHAPCTSPLPVYPRMVVFVGVEGVSYFGRLELSFALGAERIWKQEFEGNPHRVRLCNEVFWL
jgi:hypothetical protein